MSDPEAIKAHFTAALPRIEQVARFRFRHLNPELQEEKVQETVALAWKSYRNLVNRGKNPDDFISTLASFSAKAVKNGRRLTGQNRASDVMGDKAKKKHGYEVKTIPDHDPPDEPSEVLDALQDRKSRPDSAAAFRIDYPEFLEEFKPRDRAVIVDAANGETTTDLAGFYNVSQGRVSQIRTLAKKAWAERGLPPDERER
jgi:DNA-directed RNA polymerase specialized sigma24 family protein